MREPRMARSCSFEAESRSTDGVSVTLSLACPEVRACGGSKPINASDVTDLPEPDSPTSPSTSPGAVEKLTSRTAVKAAWSAPAWPGPGNCTERLQTSSNEALTASWYQHAAQPLKALRGATESVSQLRTVSKSGSDGETQPRSSPRI